MNIILIAMVVLLFIAIPSIRWFVVLVAAGMFLAASSVNVTRRVSMMTAPTESSQHSGYTRQFSVQRAEHGMVGQIKVFTTDSERGMVQYYRYTGQMAPVQRDDKNEFTPEGEGELMLFEYNLLTRMHAFIFMMGQFDRSVQVGNTDQPRLREGVRAKYIVQPVEDVPSSNLEKFYSDDQRLFEFTFDDMVKMHRLGRVRVEQLRLGVGLFNAERLYNGYSHEQKRDQSGRYVNSKAQIVNGESVPQRMAYELHNDEPLLSLPVYHPSVMQSAADRRRIAAPQIVDDPAVVL